MSAAACKCPSTSTSLPIPRHPFRDTINPHGDVDMDTNLHARTGAPGSCASNVARIVAR
jgi:hypothetical protein